MAGQWKGAGGGCGVGRAASGYTQHDEPQRRRADLPLAPAGALATLRSADAGCGPGSMSCHWRAEAGSVVTALDLRRDASPRRSAAPDAAQHYLLGDIEALLPDACVDLAWSNLRQWCDDSRRQLASCTGWRVPAGREWRLASPLADSLPELNQACAGPPVDRSRMPTVSLAKRRCARRLAACATGEGLSQRPPFADALSAAFAEGHRATHLHQADRRPAWPRQTARAAVGSPQRQGICPLTYSLYRSH